MTPPFGIGASGASGLPAIAPAASAPAAELLNPPPILPSAASFIATVLERNPDGALLLRSAFGTLTLKTPQSLAPGARVEVRITPGNPPTVTILALGDAEPEPSEPPMRLDLGTTLTATLVSNGGALATGTRLTLRVGAPAGGTSLLGQIAFGTAGETLIETEIGTLALDRRLALPAGTAIAFERLGATAPGNIVLPPTQASGWPTLDQALAILDKSAPALAQQMRAELAPGSAPELAGTLLFLMGALYGGRWPGEKVDRALAAAGHDRVKARLGDDLAGLGRLRGDEATGAWRVLVLPLLAGACVQPLRLYLRRRGAATGPDDGTRFVIEAELSRLGTLQLDGLVRGQRIDLVLRSHAPLDGGFHREAGDIFHRACAAAGFHGDILFATANAFAVAPLAPLRTPVEMRV